MSLGRLRPGSNGSALTDVGAIMGAASAEARKTAAIAVRDIDI
jgi:hypothetical protein